MFSFVGNIYSTVFNTFDIFNVSPTFVIVRIMNTFWFLLQVFNF